MDEREPELKNTEYLAFKYLACYVDASMEAEKALKARAQTIPHGWRDLRLIRVLGEKLCQNLFETFPQKKRKAIRAEWELLSPRVDLKPPLGLPYTPTPEYTTVPIPALQALIRRVVGWECTGCVLDAKGRKKCPLRKDLEETYLFDVPEVRKGECPFATMACHAELEGEP